MKEMSPFLESIVSSLPVSDVKLQQIIAAQAEDPVCTIVKEYIMEGWPDKYKIPDSLKSYWNLGVSSLWWETSFSKQREF